MYRKNIKLDYFHTFFRNFNLSSGIWMIYLFYQGFNYIEIAIFETLFHVSSLTFEIPTGVIADIFGRKVSRMLGIILYLVYIVLLLSSTNVYIISLAFIICGLSYTLESGAGEALIYDSLKEDENEDNFMKVNGRKEVILQSASFTALLVSGRMFEIHYSLPFIFTGAMFVLGLLSILLMKEVEVKQEKKTIKELLKDQFVISTQVVLKNKRLFFLILIGALMLAPITTIFFFIQNRLDEMQFTFTFITIILAGHAFMAALGGFFAQTLERKYGEKKILNLIPIFIVICFWLLNTGIYMIIPFIIVGFFDSIFYVVLTDYINKMVESKMRATVLSFFGMAFSIVMIVIFMLVGIIGELISLQTAFIALAIIVTIFYILLLPVLKGTKEVL